MASGRPELTAAVARLNNALKRLVERLGDLRRGPALRDGRLPFVDVAAPGGLDCRLRAPPQLPRRHAPRDRLLPDIRVAAPALAEHRAARLFSGGGRRGQNRGLAAIAEDGHDDRRDLAIFHKTVAELLDIMRGVFAEVPSSMTPRRWRTSTARSPRTATRSPCRRRRCTSTPSCPTWPSRRATSRCWATRSCRRARSSGFPGTSVPGRPGRPQSPPDRVPVGRPGISASTSRTPRRRSRGTGSAGGRSARASGRCSRRRRRSRRARSGQRRREPGRGRRRGAAGAGRRPRRLRLPHRHGHGLGLATTSRRGASCRRSSRSSRRDGFVVRDETLNGREAWLGSLPGHVWANVRRPLVSSLNLAHLLPLSAVWAGEAENDHLEEGVRRGRAPTSPAAPRARPLSA